MEEYKRNKLLSYIIEHMATNYYILCGDLVLGRPL